MARIYNKAKRRFWGTFWRTVSEPAPSIIEQNGFVTDGLALFLHAAKNTQGEYSDNSTSWYDLTGNGNNGSLYNYAYNTSSGWVGDNTTTTPTVLLSDGTDDYVEVLNNTQLNQTVFSGQFTVNVKAYSTYDRIFAKGDYNTGAGVSLEVSSTGNWALQMWRGGVTSSIFTITDVPINTDHNIAFTYNGTKLTVYKDSVLLGTITCSLPSNDLDLRLFRGSGGNNNNITAQINHFSWYSNKILTQAEVTQNYEAGLVWEPWLTSVVPNMTSATTPTGYEVTSSTAYDPNYYGWHAFNGDIQGNPLSWATSNWDMPCWLQIELPISKVVSKYVIYPRLSSPVYSHHECPKDWTFEGSINGTDWNILDTRTDQTTDEATSVRSYNTNNVASYKYYRIYITANNGKSYTDISELRLFEGVAP